MKKKIVASFILFAVSISCIATPPIINNIIFFGDSLSDVGNNTWILLNNTMGAPITNPNAQNNKSIWINYLVDQKLNQPVYPSNSLHINPLMDNVSYAYASATTVNHYLNTDWPQNDPPDPTVNSVCIQPGLVKDTAGNITSTCVPGLQKQVDLYLNQVQLKPNQNTVFFIWTGANDLTYWYIPYVRNMAKDRLFFARFSLPSQNELDAVEQQAVDNINAAIKKLIDAGVKSEMIYILNLPDLSKIPQVTMNNTWSLKYFLGKQNTENNLSELSKGFNQKLQLQRGDLKYQIPVVNYIPVDQWFLDMVSHSDKYNLTNVNESCAANNALPACSGYLFYNDKHPTTYVNKIIADKVLKLLSE